MIDADVVRTGQVRVWHVDEGWGVLDADDLPGGCWAHFSVLAMDGYKTLMAGETISFRCDTRGQDGYDFAASKVWRGADEPADLAFEPGPPGGYHSVFTVTFDEGGRTPPE